MRNFVKTLGMIAKLRLIQNASAIEDAYVELGEYIQMSGEERKGIRKPRIPKPKYTYAPMALDPCGVRLAYQEGDVIQLKHSDSPDWLPIKNEPQVWAEIQSQLSNVKISGFLKRK